MSKKPEMALLPALALANSVNGPQFFCFFTYKMKLFQP